MIGWVLAACDGEKVELPTEPTVPNVDTVPEVLSSEPCDACDGDCVLEELAYPTQAYHTSEPVLYADRPPAGGPHDPCWATWGAHREPLPDERWVHNLEHGGVVYVYQDPVPSAVTALEALADEKGVFVLVAPYADMDSPYAAISWGFRMLTGCVDDEAFRAFYDEHVDQAPESLPQDPGSACE